MLPLRFANNRWLDRAKRTLMFKSLFNILECKSDTLKWCKNSVRLLDLYLFIWTISYIGDVKNNEPYPFIDEEYG